MLRTVCLTGNERASDGIAVPLNALRLPTRADTRVLFCTELMQLVVIMVSVYEYAMSF